MTDIMEGISPLPQDGSWFTIMEPVTYRWKPYKPDGVRQMGRNGRWQRMRVNGDWHSWENCEQPNGATVESVYRACNLYPKLRAFIEGITHDDLDGKHGLEMQRRALELLAECNGGVN